MSLIEECCMGFHMRRLVSESPYGGKDDLFDSEGFVNAAILEMFLLQMFIRYFVQNIQLQQSISFQAVTLDG